MSLGIVASAYTAPAGGGGAVPTIVNSTKSREGTTVSGTTFPYLNGGATGDIWAVFLENENATTSPTLGVTGFTAGTMGGDTTAGNEMWARWFWKAYAGETSSNTFAVTGTGSLWSYVYLLLIRGGNVATIATSTPDYEAAFGTGHLHEVSGVTAPADNSLAIMGYASFNGATTTRPSGWANVHVTGNYFYIWSNTLAAGASGTQAVTYGGSHTATIAAIVAIGPA